MKKPAIHSILATAKFLHKMREKCLIKLNKNWCKFLYVSLAQKLYSPLYYRFSSNLWRYHFGIRIVGKNKKVYQNFAKKFPQIKKNNNFLVNDLCFKPNLCYKIYAHIKFSVSFCLLIFKSLIILVLFMNTYMNLLLVH